MANDLGFTNPGTQPWGMANKACTLAFRAMQAPSVVPVLSHTVTGDTTFTITLPEVSAGETINLEVRLASDQSAFVAPTGLSANYFATDATASTTYEYRGQIVNSAGPGPWSAWASLTTQAAAGGSAPSATAFDQILLYADFEGGNVGDSINTITPLGNCSSVTISATRASTGTRSAHDNILPGAGDFSMGWSYDAMPDIAKGDEVWVRLDVWIPPDPITLSGNETNGLKWFRFRQVDSGGAFANFFDLYYMEDISGNFVKWTIRQENPLASNGQPWVTGSQAARLVHGHWNRVDYYVHVDDVAADAGGTGKIRLWVNDAFAGELSHRTLPSATHKYESMYFITHWNPWDPTPESGEPADYATTGPRQSLDLYYDNFAVAVKTAFRDDTAHLAEDSGGRKWIGPVAPAAFTPLLAEDFSAGTVGSQYAGWKIGSDYDDTRAFSGSQSLRIRTTPVDPPNAGGSVHFGGRPANSIPAGGVPEGYRLWYSAKVYHPAGFSWGYCYGTRDDMQILVGAGAGDSTISVDASQAALFPPAPGMFCGIELDSGSWHYTTMASGTSGNTVVLTDPLPGAVSATTSQSKFLTGDRAEAQFNGKSGDGADVLKYLVLAPNLGSRRIYYQPERNRRALAHAGEMSISAEGGASTRAASIPWGFTADTWHTVQIEVMVSSDPAVGYVRAWLDDTYLGQLSTDTVAAGNKLTEWGIGDWWNGIPYTDDPTLADSTRTDFWLDEVILATDMPGYGAPTGVDSGGRAYIDPNTTVASLST